MDEASAGITVEEYKELRRRLEAVEKELERMTRTNEELCRENQALREENERLKRTLNNNSRNSSLPPSTNQPGRAANTYNSRKSTGKKAGGQPGHKGRHLSAADVKKKIESGEYEHRFEEIGTPGEKYIIRYRLDLEVRTIATEIKIYADENGNYNIPEEMKAEVFYGNGVKAIAGLLFGEGNLANDKIQEFINSISGDSLNISAGSIYGFCEEMGQKCEELRPEIEGQISNAEVVCTDATTVKTNGKQSYIRNFSTEDSVLYEASSRKNLSSLKGMRVLKNYKGILEHDHETAMYHFGTGHGECNVHIARYLQKNTEETRNTWSRDMSGFLHGMNCARKELIRAGEESFTQEQLERYESRYDEIIAMGREQNQHTQGAVAKREESRLLNRLTKYKSNHLLFLHNFNVPFSNNMSEKDLRTCKTRQKMSGGFRTEEGRQMFCNIKSIIETVKRRGMNVYQSIVSLFAGKLALS